ncbi:MAG: cyclic nucleotide-binding domain-containing protein [Deltaproteobacteria bacterium]|nr:cyclic nucleotide-binding domain-containing protein [Deltaproteobacteria bacterium]
MDGPVKTALLRDIAVFEGLADEVIDKLASSLEVRRCEPGSSVFKEGDLSRELFIVLSGELEILKKSRRGRDARIALVGVGDSVGEMSLVDDQPRSATVRAISPSRLLRFGVDDMEKLQRLDQPSYATIVLNLAREISRRLRVADGIIADFVAQVWDAYLAPAKR